MSHTEVGESLFVSVVALLLLLSGDSTGMEKLVQLGPTMLGFYFLPKSLTSLILYPAGS